MNRCLTGFEVRTCGRIACRADDRGTPYALVCVLDDGHAGRCVTTWRETTR